MIEIYKTDNLREDSFFYFSPDQIQEAGEFMDKLSAVALVTKDDKEFDKLVEVVLEFFLKDHYLYALLVERFPAYKRRLRSYAGMNYFWRKEYGEESYQEKEFDLPENQSLFAAVLKLDPEKVSPFVQYLVNSYLAFWLLSDEPIEKIEQSPDLFLNDLFEELVPISKMIYVNWERGVIQFADDHTLLFRVQTDGQDRIRLQFYGCRDVLLPKMDLLLARLQENFHLRRRRPWMDVNN